MSVENPWKTLATKHIYKNPWITVREDSVICPDGSPGIYGVVETRVATGVIALTEDLDVYLVGQYRYPTKEYSWEIPEGGTEVGEAPLEAAKRELLEEAGLIASEWQQLGGEIHMSNCISAERAYLYVAKGLEERASSPDHTEVLQVKRVPLEKVLEMIEKGEIKDSLTVIGILHLSRILGKA